jgi:hypothetical protein
MKKQIKFNEKQVQLINKSIDAFKNDTVKSVAKTYFGGTNPVSHSKGTYSQTYRRYALNQ